jgi:hypothetical protein
MSSVAHSPLFVASPVRLAADAFIGAHGALAAGVVPCAAMMMITTMPISVT